MNPLYMKDSSADSASQHVSPLLPPPWWPVLRRPVTSDSVSNRSLTFSLTPRTDKPNTWLFVSDSASLPDPAADASCAAAAVNAGINPVSLAIFIDGRVWLNADPLDVAQGLRRLPLSRTQEHTLP